MEKKWRTMGMAIVCAGIAILPLRQAKADEWNQETTVTLSAPMEIPGQVLPAGNYVFQLAENSSDRNIVEIFNEDKTQIIATVIAIPAYRLEPASDSVMTVREQPAGAPEALSRWFFAGEARGVGFVYPNEQ